MRVTKVTIDAPFPSIRVAVTGTNASALPGVVRVHRPGEHRRADTEQRDEHAGDQHRGRPPARPRLAAPVAAPDRGRARRGRRRGAHRLLGPHPVVLAAVPRSPSTA